MATRRNVSSTEDQKPLVVQDPTSSIAATSTASAAVPTSTVIKLLAFTFAMVTFPIGSYFLSLWYIFEDNTFFPACIAAVVANLVLIGYIVMAVEEDQGDQKAAIEAEAKKAR